MDANRLTHLYGISSLVVGGVGIFMGFKVGADWKEISLFASGWITAITISFHLRSSMNFHGDSSDKVVDVNNSLSASKQEFLDLKNSFESKEKEFLYEKKQMQSEIDRINELLIQRTMTLDFVASVKMPSVAISRKDDESLEAKV